MDPSLEQIHRRDRLFAIALAALVGLLAWFSHAIIDLFAPSSGIVTVPAFVGQTLADAKHNAAQLHLATTVITTATSEKYPAGIVSKQRPLPGSSVREGRRIGFVVSSGVLEHRMPDLRFESMREVELDLARAGLVLGTTTDAKSVTIPAGHVISQSPKPLDPVESHQTVNLVMSSGGARGGIVPDFTGMSIDAVRARAAKEGITLGQIVWTPLGFGAAAHGIVVRENPKAGAKFSPYQTLSLQVSAGPHQSGYLIRQAHVLLTVPVPDGSTADTKLHIRLMVNDATGAYPLLDSFALPGQKIDLTVSTVGTSSLEFYVNDHLISRTQLGFEPAAVYDEKPPKETAP
ncbi:MAG: PASTA domain-containing protein [Vulcanimicrobiaceae bacterium]